MKSSSFFHSFFKSSYLVLYLHVTSEAVQEVWQSVPLNFHKKKAAFPCTRKGGRQSFCIILFLYIVLAGQSVGHSFVYVAHFVLQDSQYSLFIISCLASEYLLGIISNFFENSRRYSRMNVCQQCQRHRRKKTKFLR